MRIASFRVAAPQRPLATPHVSVAEVPPCLTLKLTQVQASPILAWGPFSHL